MRRAKIICTLGPATDGEEQVRALVNAGMDIARLNLSHGAYAEHEERYRQESALDELDDAEVAVIMEADKAPTAGAPATAEIG